MTTRKLPIGTGSNLDISDTSTGDSAAVSFINAYPDRSGAIRAVPGRTQYADLGVNGDVWSYYSVQFDVAVIVCDGRAWVQREAYGVVTEITGVNLTAGEPPTFAEDGVGATTVDGTRTSLLGNERIFFAANSQIHSFAPGGTTAEIITTGPVGVTSIVYVGGYLMANGERPTFPLAGDTHYSDDKANGYAAWELYNNESRADALQSLVVAYEQIYNIGRTTLEVSYIDGTVPFSVNKNAAQHFGTMAKYSVAFDGENIYYLSEVAGSRKIIHLQGGGTPGIISFPVDVPLERFERVDDARGFIFSFAGQNGYALTFPTANTEVDAQFYRSITLFYHLQSKEWVILGRWDAAQGQYGAFSSVSATYAEPWGLRLLGGNDGKLYRMVESEYAEGDYDTEYVILHRWRDDGNREWKPYKTISTGKQGEYRNAPLRRGPNGSYCKRQHEIVYVDQSDGGENFRAAIRTGNISYGTTSKRKRSILYNYDIERGKGRFVLNGIEEELDVLRS